MGKLSGIKEAIEKAAKALDMSQAARMQRAAEQGFDTKMYHSSKTVFAGSPQAEEAVKYGVPVESQFKIPYGGAYFANDAEITDTIFAQGTPFSGTAEYFVRKGNNFNAEYKMMSESDKSVLNKIVSDVIDEEDIAEASAKLDIPIEDIDAFDAFTDGEFFQFFGRDKQNQVLEELKKKGYDSVTFPDKQKLYDELTTSTVLFNPSNIRSINAAFDPAQKESSNLLASFAPAAVGTGLAALGLSPDETQAAINRYMQMTQPQSGLAEEWAAKLNPAPLNERGIPITGEMRATPFPGLMALGENIRKVQTPLGPVFGGLADYLGKLGGGEDVTYTDRLGAALDVIP